MQKYSQKEIQLINDLNNQHYSVTQMAKILGRNLHGLFNKIKELRIKINNNRNKCKWTKNKINKIKNMVKNSKTTKEIADYFNVSVRIIKSLFYYRKIKIGKSFEPQKWTEKQIHFLNEQYRKLGAEKCSEIINHPIGSVYIKASELGLCANKETRNKLQDREFLYNEYIVKKKTIRKIADDIGVVHETVRRNLKKLNIKLRTKYEQLAIDRPSCGLLSMTYFNVIKNHAKQNKRKFSLNMEYCWSLYEKQCGNCALSGEPILLIKEYHGKNRRKQTASLDRIDSNLPYIEGNVQWIHKDLQWIKCDFPENELFNWTKKVTNYQTNKLLKSIKNSDLIILDYEGMEINRISTCPKSHPPPFLL